MKKTKVFYLLYVLFFMASVVIQATLSAGCASAPPERIALRSLQVTAKSVETSMKVAGELHSNGFIDDNQKEEVLKAYATYQKSMNLAILLLDTINSRADADALSAKVKATADALVNLIASFQSVPRAVPQTFQFNPTFNPLTFMSL